MGIKVVYSRELSSTVSEKDARRSIPTKSKAREFVRQLGWDDIATKYHGLVLDVADELNYYSVDYFRILLNVHTKEHILNAKPGWGAIRNALTNCYALIHATKINTGEKKVIFAPTSGFHHAGYGYAWGFCTFNGLVAAALSLKGKVLILDGDQHFGDGTTDIINRLDLQDRITNYSITAWNDIPDFKGYDHIIYQAGADAHYLDGGYLNDDTWIKRDKLVFEQAKKLDIPITVTFAGGYSSLSKVVELHLSTYWTAYEIYYGIDEVKVLKQELARPDDRELTFKNKRAREILYGQLSAPFFYKHFFKTWRERNNWSLFSAALVLGVLPKRYESIEAGRIQPTQKILAACKVAGIFHAIQRLAKPYVSFDVGEFNWILVNTRAHFGDPKAVYDDLKKDLHLLTGDDLLWKI